MEIPKFVFFQFKKCTNCQEHVIITHRIELVFMNRKGFIATSLIYSFFLVFIAIIAALLNNFIANKNILTRYNEDAQESLNNNKYTVKVVTSGAETNTTTQRGQTLYNLVRDGRFQNLNL